MPDKSTATAPRSAALPSSSNDGRIRGAALRALRSRAQKLEPIVKIGRPGITVALTASLDQALALHELVKARFVEHKDERKTMAEELAKLTRSQLVWIIGHVAVFYRKLPQAATQATGAQKT
jgi:RNA-binding protein